MFKALTAAFLICASGCFAQTSAEVTDYKRATAKMRTGDWSLALGLGERAGPVARDIIEWQHLQAGLRTREQLLNWQIAFPRRNAVAVRSAATRLPLRGQCRDCADFYQNAPTSRLIPRVDTPGDT